MENQPSTITFYDYSSTFELDETISLIEFDEYAYDSSSPYPNSKCATSAYTSTLMVNSYTPPFALAEFTVKLVNGVPSECTHPPFKHVYAVCHNHQLYAHLIVCVHNAPPSPPRSTSVEQALRIETLVGPQAGDPNQL